MTTIDVHDLPEPIARAVEETVRHLRDQLRKRAANGQVSLPEWKLGVRGTLSRDEIYDYLDEREQADTT